MYHTSCVAIQSRVWDHLEAPSSRHGGSISSISGIGSISYSDTQLWEHLETPIYRYQRGYPPDTEALHVSRAESRAHSSDTAMTMGEHLDPLAQLGHS